MTHISPTTSEVVKLDSTYREASQTVLESAHAEVQGLKNAFEKLTAELMKRDAKIVVLKERLCIPLPALPPQEPREVVSLAPSPREPVASLIEYGKISMELIQSILRGLADDRDFYLKGLEALAPKLDQRDLEIQTLEQKLKAQEKPAASPNHHLREHIAQVDVSYIHSDTEKMQVLQNLTYMLYQEKLAASNSPHKDLEFRKENEQALLQDPVLKRAAQEALLKITEKPFEISDIIRSVIDSDEKTLAQKAEESARSPKDFLHLKAAQVLQYRTYLIYREKLTALKAKDSSFKETQLSKENEKALQQDPILMEAAQEALIEAKVMPYDVVNLIKTLISSHERNVTHKAASYDQSPKKFTSERDLNRQITSSIALAETIFGHFVVKKKEYDQHRQRLGRSPKVAKEAKYSDFPFNNLGLLAGQIRLILRIFTDCKNQLPAKDPKREEIEAKIKEIEDIRTNFSNLLNKCRLRGMGPFAN